MVVVAVALAGVSGAYAPFILGGCGRLKLAPSADGPSLLMTVLC